MKLYIDLTAVLPSKLCEDTADNEEKIDESTVKTLKITIPNTWKEKKCVELANFIIKIVNTHLKNNEFTLTNVLLSCCNVELNLSSSIGSFLHEYNTIVVERTKQIDINPIISHDSVRCTNYGCGKYYTEDENNDEACHYHEKNVVFHDCIKYWACCPGRKAYDWEEFEKLPTCKVGRHSTKLIKNVRAGKSFDENNSIEKSLCEKEEHKLTSPLAAAAAAAMTTCNEKNTADSETFQYMKKENETAQIEEEEEEESKVRCHAGPREFKTKNIHSASKDENEPDGFARCINFGCGKVFCELENNEEACIHHKQGPVFWDTYKYWKCCPDKKCYDFDDFTNIKGCCTGPHKTVKDEKREESLFFSFRKRINKVCK